MNKANTLKKSDVVFEFGENWSNFAQNVDEENIQRASKDLKFLLGDISLTGKSFLDIGCGSGIHGLCALKLGASKLYGVDVDPNSVQTAKNFLAKYSSSDDYKIEQASILAVDSFTDEKFDIVYSWGVLHHTGDMWCAIENATRYVQNGGHFIIAIYKKTPFCSFWKAEKKFYCRAPKPIRMILNTVYGLAQIVGLIATGRNPIRYIKDYKHQRGMKWSTDITDWLGGYPYESATAQEIKEFIEARGFKTIKIAKDKPAPIWGILGTGCAEYVFQKVSA